MSDIPQEQSQQSQGVNSNQGNNNNNNSNNNKNNRQKKNTHAPKRGPIIDMKKYLNTEIIARVSKGREIRGKLIGYDFWMNMVLEDATITTPDYVQKQENAESKIEKVSKAVILGRLLFSFEPIDGYEVITNPDFQPEAVI